VTQNEQRKTLLGLYSLYLQHKTCVNINKIIFFYYQNSKILLKAVLRYFKAFLAVHRPPQATTKISKNKKIYFTLQILRSKLDMLLVFIRESTTRQDVLSASIRSELSYINHEYQSINKILMIFRQNMDLLLTKFDLPNSL